MTARDRYDNGYYDALTDVLRGKVKSWQVMPLDEIYRKGYAEGLKYMEKEPSLLQMCADFHAKENHEDFTDIMPDNMTKDQTRAWYAQYTTPEKELEALKKDLVSFENEPYKLTFVKTLASVIVRRINEKNVPTFDDAKAYLKEVDRDNTARKRRGRIIAGDLEDPHIGHTATIMFRPCPKEKNPETHFIGPLAVSFDRTTYSAKEKRFLCDPKFYITSEGLLDKKEMVNTAIDLFNVLSNICGKNSLSGVEVRLEGKTPFGHDVLPVLIRGAVSNFKDHDLHILTLRHQLIRELTLDPTIPRGEEAERQKQEKEAAERERKRLLSSRIPDHNVLSRSSANSTQRDRGEIIR